MDDLRMANIDALTKEIDGFLVGVKECDALPADDSDASWKLHVSEDLIEARLETRPFAGQGTPLDADAVIAAIQEAGIQRGEEERIRAIVAQCNSGGSVIGKDALVAKGIPPVAPVEGRIEFLVSFEKVRLMDLDDEHAVDWKNLWRVPVVHVGDAIARVHLPSEGRPGIDVYGKPLLPRCPIPFNVKYGEGVVLSESEEEGGAEVITAREIGQPVFLNETLDVLPVLRLLGDVDIKSGDIEFIGSVVVCGSITDGFSVKAGRDVVVDGSVFNARVEAGGSCIVRCGIVGKLCEVRAVEDVRAGFVEYGKVVSGANIEILGYTLFAALEASKSVFVQGRNRRGIIGGTTVAGVMIKTLSAGSAKEPKTLLEAGRDVAGSAKIEKMKKQLNEMEEITAKIERSIHSLKGGDSENSPRSLSEDEDGKLMLLTNYHGKMDVYIKDLKEKIGEEKRVLLSEKKFFPIVRIRDVLHPNVTVKIWESLVLIFSKEVHVSFSYNRETGSIRKGAY